MRDAKVPVVRAPCRLRIRTYPAPVRILRFLWRRLVWVFRVAFILGVAALSPFAPPAELPPPPPADTSETAEDGEEP